MTLLGVLVTDVYHNLKSSNVLKTFSRIEQGKFYSFNSGSALIKDKFQDVDHYHFRTDFYINDKN